ncbi:MAG: radical SAM protein [Vicinamibacterales bacterium]
MAASDLAGRLFSYYRDGHTWRRGLNGRMLHRWRGREGTTPAACDIEAQARRREGASREALAPDSAEAAAVVDLAAALFRNALEACRGNSWKWTPHLERAARQVLEDALRRPASFTSDVAQQDAAWFASVYRPVGILPPDQYLSLVLQATEGCSFGSCTFCGLYRDGYRVKTVEEFRRHMAEVRDYMGGSLLLRRQSIFLGAANALAIPMVRLVPILEAIAGEGEFRERPISAFVDGFTGARKDERDYMALKALGLRRVYIGLESGHDALLELVKKPGTAADAVGVVRAIKAAGLSAGVIVIMGLGGLRFAKAHVIDTANAVNSMGLGAGDILYLSNLVEDAGTEYPRLARDAVLEPLAPADFLAQKSSLRALLRFTGAPPRVATYDIREFIY